MRNNILSRGSIFVLPLLTLLASGLASAATQFEIDPDHSGVNFKVRHLFSPVPGNFKKYKGSFTYDPANPKAWATSVEIDASSIFTDHAKRDDHLRGPDFFDVKKHPTITFVSKEVKDVTKESATLLGDLTMHGVTKPVALKMEIGGMGKDPWGGTRAGFTATTKINRKDFGITWNKALDSGGMLLGDDVEISLAVEGKEAAAASKK